MGDATGAGAKEVLKVIERRVLERVAELEQQRDEARQRLAEAEGLLARLAEAARRCVESHLVGGTDRLRAPLADYDTYRTKYTPEPPE